MGPACAAGPRVRGPFATKKTLKFMPSMAGLANGHYEDPNDGGCGSDEQDVQIQGIAGSFCSPKCNALGKCPTDVPAGTQAAPTCALQDPQGDKYCALICQPNAGSGAGQCPSNSTCKPIQGTGLCTYD